MKKITISNSLDFSDLAGIRTQDPYIKSVLLYQLSYQVLTESLLFFSGAKISKFFKVQNFLANLLKNL